ncbi:hypothetical protein D5282_26700, partial [bacterium 1xD8-48]|nr:hypothetical protein [bacterium 1xD8-48]
CHILILTKKEVFFSKDTNYFTLPPLKGCVIQTPVPPDTIKIPAELFLYHERVDEWTETII